MPIKYNEKYTRELLTEAVANSISIGGVLRYLGIPLAGGTHAHITRKVKQFGIDTSHFKRGGSEQRKAFRAAAHPGTDSGRALTRLATAEGTCAAPGTARGRRAVRLRNMWNGTWVERQADSIECRSYRRKLAR